MKHKKLAGCMIATPIVVVVVLLAIPCVWAFLYFGVYHGYGRFQVRHHQDFAQNGVLLIAPAAEMDALFLDCRHSIRYGAGGVPEFESVAYFGERYKLVMRVPVTIESPVKGHVTGDARFWLHEVRDVTRRADGAIETRYSRQLDFGPAEWQQIREAGGDFGAIGFDIDPTPVENFGWLTEPRRGRE